jgi:hypothetical protein
VLQALVEALLEGPAARIELIDKRQLPREDISAGS